MTAFTGKWALTESENFDEYMKELGVGFVMRKLANSTKPTQEITFHDGVMTIKTLSTARNMETSFSFGKEFEETLPDGEKAQSLVELESETKMVHTQKTSKNTRRVVREVNGDTYITTMEVNGVVAKRTYKRIPN